jgi:D-alanyl-lipoteichoic acid acyltransferase DltB (MBOAT superfamily)
MGDTVSPHWLPRTLSTLATFHFVCVGWALFVCDLDKAWAIILRLLFQATAQSRSRRRTRQQRRLKTGLQPAP